MATRSIEKDAEYQIPQMERYIGTAGSANLRSLSASIYYRLAHMPNIFSQSAQAFLLDKTLYAYRRSAQKYRAKQRFIAAANNYARAAIITARTGHTTRAAATGQDAIWCYARAADIEAGASQHLFSALLYQKAELLAADYDVKNSTYAIKAVNCFVKAGNARQQIGQSRDAIELYVRAHTILGNLTHRIDGLQLFKKCNELEVMIARTYDKAGDTATNEIIHKPDNHYAYAMRWARQSNNFELIQQLASKHAKLYQNAAMNNAAYHSIEYLFDNFLKPAIDLAEESGDIDLISRIKQYAAARYERAAEMVVHQQQETIERYLGKALLLRTESGDQFGTVRIKRNMREKHILPNKFLR